MPSWNSDREGHVDHRWVVQKADKNDYSNGVETSRGLLKYDNYGRLLVKDPGLAAEIRTERAADLAVTRVRYPHKSDRGHRYFFSIPFEMPWKRKQTEQSEGET